MKCFSLKIIAIVVVFLNVKSGSSAQIVYDTIVHFDTATYTETVKIIERELSVAEKYPYCKSERVEDSCYYLSLTKERIVKFSQPEFYFEIEPGKDVQFNYQSDVSCQCIAKLIFAELEIFEEKMMKNRYQFTDMPFHLDKNILITNTDSLVNEHRFILKNQVVLLNNGTVHKLPDKKLTISVQK